MVQKRLEGRDEPILDPDLEIIDTHHHLFDRPGIRYLFEEYLADVRCGHNIVASVYVDAQSMVRPAGPELLRPLGEVEFANGMGAVAASGVYGDCRIATAIVAHGNLSAGDDVARYLDKAQAVAPERLRGIRQIVFTHPSEAIKPFMRYHCAAGILGSDSFRAGFRHLAPRGLSFDATVFHTQLGELGALADAFAETSIILDHLGLAVEIGLDARQRQETFGVWRAGLRSLARRPNVTCKISGLGLPYWGFGLHERTQTNSSPELAEVWRPYVETAIEAFGPDRCMMASDFPPDGMSCGFVPLWNAMKRIVATYTAQEKRTLFQQTAARIYKIAF